MAQQPDPLAVLNKRVDELAEDLRAVTARIARLEASPVSTPIPSDFPLRTPAVQPPGDASEKMLDWVGDSHLLPRVATLSFLMVVALLLRTVTDYGLVNTAIGALLGLSYAVALLALGWHKYNRGDQLSPVFLVSGAVLIFAIVVETHGHFGWLPAVPAYLLIGSAAAVLTVLSMLRQKWLPAVAGVAGGSVAACAIDFPDPYFPHLMAVLVLLNLAAFRVAGIRGCGALRWFIVIVTLVVPLVWRSKLLLPGLGAAARAALAPGWFFPLVLAVAGLNLASAVAGMLRGEEGRIALFDLLLPNLTVLWLFLLLDSPLPAPLPAAAMAGTGAAAGAFHIGLAWRLGTRQRLSHYAGPALFLAGTLLLLRWLPDVAGPFGTLIALSALAALAGGVASGSGNTPLLVLAYLIQLYAALTLALLLGNVQKTPLAAGAGAAAAVGGLSLWQYVARRRAAMEKIRAVLLLAALISAFLLLRLLTYRIALSTQADINSAFASAQSLIINASAIILMLLALWGRDRELRMAAIFALLVGGAKVFCLDLLTLHGVPVVLSVFSFGLAVAAQSVLLGRWRKR